MDSKGRWVHSSFYRNKIFLKLLPRTITSQDLMNLVTNMAENASKNPYLKRALEFLHDGNYPKLQRQLMQKARYVIPEVVTLAFVLEKMTSTMKDDWRFVKTCNEIWKEYDNFGKIFKISFKTGDIFNFLKALSVRKMWKGRLDALETLHLPEVNNSYAHLYLAFSKFIYRTLELMVLWST